MKFISTIFSAAAIAFLAIACGGGGGGGGSSSSVQEGVFLDSAVEGVAYETATQSGNTDSIGRFKYMPGETVTFKIGGTTLGSSTAGSKVTVIDIVTGATDETNTEVTNIARLLQTIDSDNDPSNGITVPAATVTLMENISVDFSGVNFENSVSSLISDLGATLVSSTNARAHVRETVLREVTAGVYSGSWTDNSFPHSGTWTVTIDTNGNITGSYAGDKSGTLSGTMNTSTGGAFGTADDGTSFSGTFVNGTVQGTYSYGFGSGTYSGSQR